MTNITALPSPMGNNLPAICNTEKGSADHYSMQVVLQDMQHSKPHHPSEKQLKLIC